MKKKKTPRLRLARDIDVSKAKSDCQRCQGTGVVGEKEIDDPENDGQKTKVSVICRCVTRNGGVKEDILDAMMRTMDLELKQGTFARSLASDILGLPPNSRVHAITQLENDSNNRKKSYLGRKAASEALEIIKAELANRVKEGAHGYA